MSSASRLPADLAGALRDALLGPADTAIENLRGRTDAAVLVPLFARDERLHVVLTRRNSGLRSHAGEISFPGGRKDDGETDLRQTALREAFEEIGLAASAVELIGSLTPTPTGGSNYIVHPYVGLMQPALRWTLSAREVDAVLEPTVGELRGSFGQRMLRRRGALVKSDVYALDGALVWGATARIIGDLLERLGNAGL